MVRLVSQLSSYLVEYWDHVSLSSGLGPTKIGYMQIPSKSCFNVLVGPRLVCVSRISAEALLPRDEQLHDSDNLPT